jgi:hypothetical protein
MFGLVGVVFWTLSTVKRNEAAVKLLMVNLADARTGVPPCVVADQNTVNVLFPFTMKPCAVAGAAEANTTARKRPNVRRVFMNALDV